MRIALCISGQPRSLKTNIPNLLSGLVIPSNITDIFIHTWFDESVVGHRFGSAQPGNSGLLGAYEADTIELLQTLSPKKLLVEAPRNFEEFSHLENLNSAIQCHLASNTYSVYKANELKTEYETENNFKYDLVIRARIDCKYNQPYNIINYLDTNWKNVLHVPHQHQHMRQTHHYPTVDGNGYLALSDTFAYGTSDIMDKFCSVFNDFESIHHKIKPFQYGECYFGYQSLYTHKLLHVMQPIDYYLSR